jgi:UDP-glucose 4-epimerase
MTGSSSILVTGGTGYIGSHAVVELLVAGHNVCVIDNLCNSKVSVLDRIELIAGRRPTFAEIDVRDRTGLRRFFLDHRCGAVIHFAGLKAVGESAVRPLAYYDNNVVGSIALIECMADAGVTTIVFSSSATVYGKPPPVQFCENLPLLPVNPYGRSKMIIEDVLRDVAKADSAWRVALLRYFNPVGAHASGLIGEDPNGIPNNLMPYIAQVAMGKRRELSVYGNDYPTPDGSGVRDYVHVVDLARGHLAALDALNANGDLLTVNLGTGRGYSVLDVVRTFAVASGRPVPYRVVARRDGDLAEYFSDPTLAFKTLGWQAQLGIDAMCADTWRWQRWAAENLP